MDVFGSAWTRWTEVKMLFDNVNILCSCVIGQVVTYIVFYKIHIKYKVSRIKRILWYDTHIW